MLRTILHHLRGYAHKILGTSHLYNQGALKTSYGNFENSNFAQKIMDRITRMESQINWRIYGLPANYSNLRLEQLATFNNQQSLNDLLQKIANLAKDLDEAKLLQNKIEPSFETRVIVLSSATIEFKAEDSAVYLVDPNDLLTNSVVNKDLNKNVINVSPITYLQTLGSETKAFIWLSDYLHRADPITALMTLNQIDGLANGSKFSGFAKPNLDDPRIIKGFNWDLVEKLFPNLSLKREEKVFEITKS